MSATTTSVLQNQRIQRPSTVSEEASGSHFIPLWICLRTTKTSPLLRRNRGWIMSSETAPSNFGRPVWKGGPSDQQSIRWSL